MEIWQTIHIKRNLPELIRLTNLNSEVKAVLQACDILSDEDVEVLEAKQISSGNTSACSLLYDFLKKRKSAYEVITKALLTYRQTGAAKILIDGMIKNGIEKPLTHLGIPLDVSNFAEADIEVQGKTFKTKYFFSGQNLSGVCQIFKECIPEMDYYEMIVNQYRPLVLADNKTPPEPPFYVPRYLSNRIKLDEKIFKADCNEIFVFKNMERYQIYEISQPDYKSPSETQLKGITSRFISLDRDDDWYELVKISTAPIHLIKCDTTMAEILDDVASGSSNQSKKRQFILENTSGKSDVLKFFRVDKDRVYMTEDEFVDQQCTPSQTHGVCICDTPGMGKTLLLANIARSLKIKSPKNIVAFISLASFFETIDGSLPTNHNNKGENLLQIFQHISSTQNCGDLLFNLALRKLIRVDLCFDGFDEIQSPQMAWIKELLKTILAKFTTVRFYITSRPHRRKHLENTLEAIAYDMLPFNDKNQIDFLVNYWLTKHPNILQEQIHKCAIEFLTAVKENSTSKDLDITGIPLQCMLIAEVYSDEAYTFCKTAGQRFRFTSRKTSEMYQNFIKKRMFGATCNEDEANYIRSLHVQHTYKLLFPNEQNHLDTAIPHEVIKKILVVGIMQQSVEKNNEKLNFVHRTFAEFLLAEYSAGLFSESRTGIHINQDDIQFLLGCILFSYKSINHDRRTKTFEWEQPGIVYFFDSLIYNTAESIYITERVATYFTINQPINESTKVMYDFIYAACEQNNVQIFLFWGNVLFLSENHIVRKIFTKKKLATLFFKIIKNFDNINLLTRFIGLINQVFKYELNDINEIVIRESSFIQVASEYGNYEALEFLLDKCPCNVRDLILRCVSNSYLNTSAIVSKKIDILKLLHSKDPCITEIPDVLVTNLIHIKLVNVLLKFGADMNATKDGENFLSKLHAPNSHADFHDLVKYVLLECKAEHLFKPSTKWRDPIPFIIHNIALLPQTLELILCIPDIDIYREIDGDNLLFWAVHGNKIDTVRALVKRGGDLRRQGRNNICLLHVAQEDDMIEYLIKAGLDPNCRDKNGYTPLHYATNPSNAKALLNHGANVFAKDLHGRSMLHHHGDRIEDITFFAQNGLDVNERDVDGFTPLFFCKRLKAVKCLMKLGADIRLKCNLGKSLLFDESFNKSDERKEIIIFLIENGLDVNMRDIKGRTPVFFSKELKTLQYLLESGADVNVKNIKEENALFEVVFGNSSEKTEIITYLVSNGININERDNGGSTPIFVCKELKTVKCLVELGADLKVKCNLGRNALFDEGLYKSDEKMEIIKFLVYNGVDVNERDNYGYTPIFFSKELNTVKCLVKLGAELHVKCNSGRNALFDDHINESSERAEIIRFLVRNGLNINELDNYGRAPIFFCKKLNITQCLVKLGADLQVKSKYGRNALFDEGFNESRERAEIVKFLVQNGVDVNERDLEGRTPLFFCKELKTVKCLLAQGADKYVKNNLGRNTLFDESINESDERTEIVTLLAKNEVGVNQRDNDGCTPIFFCKTLKAVKCLVELGAEIDAKCGTGKNALFNVIFVNSGEKTEIVKFLVSKGLDVNERDNGGNTPIFCCKELKTVKCLVELGADTDVKCDTGNNALFKVIWSNSSEKTEIIKFLVSKGLNVNECDNDGRTPLFVCNDLKIVRCLALLGADFHDKCKLGRSALFPIVHGSSSEKVKIIKYFINSGLGVNDQDISGSTPVFFCNELKTVSCLVDLGADISIKNSNGQNALFQIVFNNSREKTEIIKYLTNNGLDVNERDINGSPALFYCHELKTIKCLVDLGADIHARNHEGKNMLHIVAARKPTESEDILKYLVNNGLDINDSDNNGKTVLDYCKDNDLQDFLVNELELGLGALT